MMISIGVHLSISGGIYRSLEKAAALKIRALQIFLKNSNRWRAKPYTVDDLNRYFSAKKNVPDLNIIAHSGYLINLAGTGDTYKKSMVALVDEMDRAEQLDIPHLVLHPGSHGGKGIDAGIKQAAESLNRVFEKNKKTGILLETTAGQGSCIGCRFEHLKSILDAVESPGRIGVCLDTCHVFAAGYDISSPDAYRAVMKEFNDILGFDRLKLIHLNDSKRECGSGVDRHEHIGKGRIGNEGFRMLLHDSRLSRIPLVLETPKFNNDEADRMNLKKVRSLMK